MSKKLGHERLEDAMTQLNEIETMLRDTAATLAESSPNAAGLYRAAAHECSVARDMLKLALRRS